MSSRQWAVSRRQGQEAGAEAEAGETKKSILPVFSNDLTASGLTKPYFGVYEMSTEAITLEVDSEAAQVFKSASTEDQEKLQVLLGIWLKEYAKADAASLKETMTEISRKSQSRGLTPETLESILEEE